MANPAPNVHRRNVQRRFSSKIVLNGLNLEIYNGESVAIPYGSGCGKSVILKYLLGIFRPKNSSITIDENETTWINISQRDQIINKVGMIFQGAVLFDRQLIWGIVAFVQLAKNTSQKEVCETEIFKLGQEGFGPRLVDKYPGKQFCSTKKRMGPVCSVATIPAITFFDKPTTALGPILGDITDNVIVRCVKNIVATTLNTSHATMKQGHKIADCIAMIFHGTFIWIRQTDEIDDSGSKFVDNFIAGRTDGPTQVALQN